MKHCAYCGRENPDTAGRCQACGTEFERRRTPAEDVQKDAEAAAKLERIITLDNEVQAGLVDAILSDRRIPHIMQTYHDSAYDGLFQQEGWGVVLAPEQFRAEILAIVEDAKRRSSSSDPGR